MVKAEDKKYPVCIGFLKYTGTTTDNLKNGMIYRAYKSRESGCICVQNSIVDLDSFIAINYGYYEMITNDNISDFRIGDIVTMIVPTNGVNNSGRVVGIGDEHLHIDIFDGNIFTIQSGLVKHASTFKKILNLISIKINDILVK